MPVKKERLQAVAVEIPLSHGVLVVSWLEGSEAKSCVGNPFEIFGLSSQKTRDRVCFLPDGAVFMFVPFLGFSPVSAPLFGET